MSDTAGQGADRSPIDAAIVRQAAEWLVKLWSGTASDADRAASMAWRSQHPDHERAWQRLCCPGRELQNLPSAIARHALLERDSPDVGRRKTLRALGLAALIGSAGYTISRAQPWQRMVADHHTRIGETRRLVLADGSQLTLDTASAVDVHFYDTRRLLALRAGAALIETASDPAPAHRPFVVESAQGFVTALGTRYMVRQHDGRSQVVVLEGAVQIEPRQAPEQGRRVNAGEGAFFTAQLVSLPGPVSKTAAAWASGHLVAERMRVDEFLREIQRYRGGVVHCEDAVAALRVSGVFPIDDTDLALAVLEQALPVTVKRRTRYWVSVLPRQ